MIKLTNNNHKYNNIPTKHNDQFQKNSLESTKIPRLKRFENLAKIEVENDKKNFVLPCQVGEREKKLKKF